jgi:hypothetical protein
MSAFAPGFCARAAVAAMLTAVLVFAGCLGTNDSDDALGPLPPCGPSHASKRIAAARYLEGRSGVRLAYTLPPAGGEACGFATDLHRGVLYVELRTPERVSGPTVTELGCVEATLDRPAAPGIPLRPVLEVRPDRVAEKVGVDPRELVANAQDCPTVSQLQPSFGFD